jgi:hypothetical protein
MHDLSGRLWSDRERNLARARLCRELARSISLSSERQKLEEMALHYEELADAETPPKRRPPPA